MSTWSPRAHGAEGTSDQVCAARGREDHRVLAAEPAQRRRLHVILMVVGHQYHIGGRHIGFGKSVHRLGPVSEAYGARVATEVGLDPGGVHVDDRAGLVAQQ